MADFKRFVCRGCGHVFDEAHGDPDSNIKAGARWRDLPESWNCPDCGAAKNKFEPE